MLSAGSTPIAAGSRCVPPVAGQEAELHLRQRERRGRRAPRDSGSPSRAPALPPCKRR
jgi:hypothetical protein